MIDKGSVRSLLDETKKSVLFVTGVVRNEDDLRTEGFFKIATDELIPDF